MLLATLTGPLLAALCSLSLLFMVSWDSSVLGAGGGALASCRNRAAVNILGQGPGAHVLRSGTSGWDWPQNLQGLIQSKTGGPGINRQEFQHGSCRHWYRERAGRPLGCRTHLHPRRGLSKGPVPCGGPWHTGWSTFPVLTSIGL